MQTAQWLQRAQPLLGTMVIIRMSGVEPDAAHDAFDAAFAAMRHIGCVMSAHDGASDLGRLARARAGETLLLDRHTIAVLRLARQWHGLTRGAFDPVEAARKLAARRLRPAFAGLTPPGRGWQGLAFGPECSVTVAWPLWLDLGGIAKGYAVDQAIEALQRHGVRQALVNAGGDMRAIGSTAWPVQVRRASQSPASARLPRLHALRQAALATSSSQGPDVAFVRHANARSHPLGARWTDCTVCAPDCVTADVLTKWGLQARPHSLRLARVLRQAGARMWRNA